MPILILILLITTCSTPHQEATGLDRRDLNHYYLVDGAHDYKLPRLPYWANFSTAYKCRLDRSMTYININSLRESFDLDYEQGVQVQIMYNDEIFRLESRSAIKSVSFAVEEKIFLDVKQKVQQGIKLFEPPKYHEISAIWIDPFIHNKKNLSNILERQDVMRGHPLFISFCYSRLALEKIIKESGLERKNIRMLTAQAVSPYGPYKKFQYDFNLYLDELLKDKKDVTLFIPKGDKAPIQIKGKFKIKYL